MTQTLALLCLALVAYLIGSIPFSFLLARAWGVDLRAVGSGNIGATNVARSCGPIAGTLAYVLDIGKGTLAAWALWVLAPRLGLSGWSTERLSGVLMCLSLIAIAGHMFPVWLKFKGGKGVATSAGVFLFLIPTPLLLTVALFIVIFMLGRIISLASITAAVLLPVILGFHTHLGATWPGFLSWLSPAERHWPNVFLGLCIAVSAFIIYKHKSNIQRLVKGEEHRFGKTK